MKFLCAFALVGLASAVAPPRIELNMASLKAMHGVSTLEKHATPLYYKHDKGYVQPNGAEVKSVRDWTERCPVLESNAGNCPFPSATAYDHHNGQLPVEKRLFLIDLDNKSTVNGVKLPAECHAKSKVCKGVDFNKRSTYLFKYDAMDKSGNRAEQVVFALIIDDTKAPTLSFDPFYCHEKPHCVASVCAGKHPACKAYRNDQQKCEHFGRTRPQWGCKWEQPTSGRDCFDQYRTQGYVEAASSWRICAADAVDKYDGVRNSDIRFAIKDVSKNTWLVPETTPTDFKGAKNVIDTLTVGQFRVIASVHDEAGIYGEMGQNNVATIVRDINVKDTRNPWLTVHGFGIQDQKTQWDTIHYPCDPATHKWGCKVTGYPLECGTIYQASCTAKELAGQGVSNNLACEEGASLNDKLDDANLKAIFAKNSLATNPINIMHTVDQVITYTGEDSNGNPAKPQTRIVSVRDTTPPVLEVTPCTEGACTHEAGSPKAWQDPGAVCKDTCDPSPKMEDATDSDLAAYPKWDRKFDDKVLGTYKRTYRCKDKAGHITEAYRYVKVVDTTKPVITIKPCATAPKLGRPHCLEEASLTGVFTDPGAKCWDQRDGTIAMAPPAGIANLGKVGSYDITYTCKDAVGNVETAVRTVVVVDTTKPVISLKGKKVEYVEAGFPWSDPMVNCQSGCAMDNIDGDLSKRIVATGGTVNTVNAFAKFRTCAEIKTAFAKVSKGFKPSGYYTLSMKIAGKIQLQKVWCDMSNGMTYFPLENAAPVRAYNSNNGDCATVGMQMAQFVNKQAYLNVRAQFGSSYFLDGWRQTTVKSTKYICSTNGKVYKHSTLATVGDIRHAVPGEYTIKYDVKDNSKNAATTVTRKVVVRDTLPPVIVMSLPQNGGQHISDSSATGLNGVANPAGLAAHNPFISSAVSLMAEDTTTSVNGWFIGAIASAVAGVALLSMSRRETATSVPV